MKHREPVGFDDDSIQQYVDTHGTELIELAKNIESNGQLHPIIVNQDGIVCDGMRRSLACALYGLQPVIEVRDMTSEEFSAVQVSANSMRENVGVVETAWEIDSFATLFGVKKAMEKFSLTAPKAKAYIAIAQLGDAFTQCIERKLLSETQAFEMVGMAAKVTLDKFCEKTIEDFSGEQYPYTSKQALKRAIGECTWARISPYTVPYEAFGDEPAITELECYLLASESNWGKEEFLTDPSVLEARLESFRVYQEKIITDMKNFPIAYVGRGEGQTSIGTIKLAQSGDSYSVRPFLLSPEYAADSRQCPYKVIWGSSDKSDVAIWGKVAEEKQQAVVKKSQEAIDAETRQWFFDQVITKFMDIGEGIHKIEPALLKYAIDFHGNYTPALAEKVRAYHYDSRWAAELCACFVDEFVRKRNWGKSEPVFTAVLGSENNCNAWKEQIGWKMDELAKEPVQQVKMVREMTAAISYAATMAFNNDSFDKDTLWHIFREQTQEFERHSLLDYCTRGSETTNNLRTKRVKALAKGLCIDTKGMDIHTLCVAVDGSYRQKLEAWKRMNETVDLDKPLEEFIVTGGGMSGPDPDEVDLDDHNTDGDHEEEVGDEPNAEILRSQAEFRARYGEGNEDESENDDERMEREEMESMVEEPKEVFEAVETITKAKKRPKKTK